MLYDPERTDLAYLDQMIARQHIGYDNAVCRMIMSNARLLDAWSLYGFDLKEKKIHVLDPLYQGATGGALQHKHGISCMSLLLGLRVCDLHLGYGWGIREEEWSVEYHTQCTPGVLTRTPQSTCTTMLSISTG